MNSRRTLVLAGAALLVGLGGGYFIAAPSAVDIRNACVADHVVPRAGLQPGTTPKPWLPIKGPMITPKSLKDQPLQEQP